MTLCCGEMREELDSHYRQYDDFSDSSPMKEINESFFAEMDKRAQAVDVSAAVNPAYHLKPVQYHVISDLCKPVIFASCPFYFELGLKSSRNDGMGSRHPGFWLYLRNKTIFFDDSLEDYQELSAHLRQVYYIMCGEYTDYDHNSFPNENIVKNGFRFYYEQALEKLAAETSPEKSEFLRCVITGLETIKQISEKFAAAAEQKIEGAPETARGNLERIAASARRCPWEKPAGLYEGLNTLLFCREVVGTLEGAGLNTFGHVDRILYPLYKNDIENGVMTEDEAYDLIRAFLLVSDCHQNKSVIMTGFLDHEYELTLTLGGKDRNGEIYNELTKMIVRAHTELRCIYPKLICRYGNTSSEQYLAELAMPILKGQSNEILMNDDIFIPNLIAAGRSEQDAINIIGSGCWDVNIEGCGKATYAEYVNLLKPLEAVIMDRTDEIAETKFRFRNFEGVRNFDDVYDIVLDNMLEVIREKFRLIEKHGRLWPRVNPWPIFSAAMNDCLEKRRDVTDNGGRYENGTLYLGAFANVVDSLLVIKTLCFEQNICGLEQLFDAVRKNWENEDDLLLYAKKCLHFGDNQVQSNGLAARLHRDLYAGTRRLRSFNGGSLHMGYSIYTDFRSWGENMQATPDGRKKGEYVAHGIAPSRIKGNKDLTTALNSIGHIDFGLCCAGGVLNLVLPLSKMKADSMAKLMRVAAHKKIPMLQLNCVDREMLLDAQKHPEKHADLMVRVCGFSARFVTLSREWQEEFLGRTFYE